jgi:hypothetical protein
VKPRAYQARGLWSAPGQTAGCLLVTRFLLDGATAFVSSFASTLVKRPTQISCTSLSAMPLSVAKS